MIPECPDLHLSISMGGIRGVHPISEAIRQADALMYENKEKHYEGITPPLKNEDSIG